MLNTLDTVIAFVVIMAAVSLMITILVQMASAFLSLRGKNLANALALTLETIQPTLKEKAHGLAERILKDPILSDSLASPKSRHAFPIPEELRSKAWGMLNPLGGFALSTAVRPGEVYRILQTLKSMTVNPNDAISVALKQTATDVLTALNSSDQSTDEAKAKLAAIINLSNTQTSGRQNETIANAVADLGATVEMAASQEYDRFQRWFGTAQDRAEQWFQTHARILTVAASFVLAFGLELDTLEIFHQLRGNPSLVQALVNSAPAVLSQGSTALDPKAGDVLFQDAYLNWRSQHPLYALKKPPGSSSLNEFANQLQQRLNEPADSAFLLAAFDPTCQAEAPPTTLPHPDASPAASPSSASPASSTSAASSPTGTPLPNPSSPKLPPTPEASYAKWKKRYPRYALTKDPDWQTANFKSVCLELRERLKTIGDEMDRDPATKAAWLDEFKTLARQQTIRALASDLDQAGFDLAPRAFMSRWVGGPEHHRGPVKSFGAWIGFTFSQVFSRHLLGMLVTAGLLTLGAPFWFNLLKNLMNLRPAVASLIERRPTSSPALPQSPATPNPPTS